MPWWGWFVIGVFLMLAELVGVDAAFYLIFVGVAAVLTGSLLLVVPGLSVSLQFVCFAVLSIATMVLFRQRLYNRFRGGAMGYKDPTLGASIVIDADLAPGATARVTHRGSPWTARNIGTTLIASGDRAVVSKTVGLELQVTSTAEASGTDSTGAEQND